MEAPARASSRVALPEACLTRRINFSLDCAGHVEFPVVSTAHKVSDAKECAQDSSTHCHHCCRPIVGDEMHVLPVAFDAFDQTYICRGRFCSPSCAKTASQLAGGVVHALFCKWATTKYGISAHQIASAPSRFALKRFGGFLSDTEFDSAIANGEVITVQEAPFVHAYTTSTTSVEPQLRNLRRPNQPIVLSRGESLSQIYADFLAQ